MQAEDADGSRSEGLEHFRTLCRVGAFVKGDLPAGQTRASYTCDSRQKDGLPLLVAFKAWLDKLALKVVPQSLPGTAIAYMGIPCEYAATSLMVVRTSMRVVIEVDVRPFATSRRSRLLSGTVDNAKASATI